jgi:fructokinase
MGLFGGIEAGGTKFVCAVASVSRPCEVLAEERFPTTTPAETVHRAIEFFEPYAADLHGLGIASFGPIDLDTSSSTYGYVTTTPKPNWAYADLVGPIARAYTVPVAFDTDVNGAALGEHHWGAAQGLDTFCYFTIGTGIGGGAMVNGSMLHGVLHPEMGHMIVPHDRTVDPFEGYCTFHKDCFEGMACGPSMEARWNAPAESLGPDHPAWDLEATYIAEAMRSVVCILSPQRIILGGGVMSQPHVLPLVRTKLLETLNGYIQAKALIDDIESYIVPPSLGNQSGVLGAIALGMKAVVDAGF